MRTRAASRERKPPQPSIARRAGTSRNQEGLETWSMWWATRGRSAALQRQHCCLDRDMLYLSTGVCRSLRPSFPFYRF